MITKHEIAFVKTTGEIVFVLDCENAEGAIVRRPIQTQDGIKHIQDGFLLAELETLEEQRQRFMAEREEVMKKYGPKVAAELTTNTDAGFPIN